MACVFWYDPAMTASFFRVIAAEPLGMITAGWKPGSDGVAAPRDFPHHVLVLTTAGHARFRDAAGRQATLAAGDVLALFPGLAHTFTPEPGQAWDEFYLIFTGPAFAPWFDHGLLAPGRPVLPTGRPDYWLSRFRGVADAGPADPPFAAIARLHAVIADLLGSVDGGAEGSADRAWLARACDLLAADSRPGLASVARRLGCSEQVFRKRFRAIAGVAPGAWRERRRLDSACGLLRTLPVAAVAARLGFCDAFHFSRRFRTRFGLPPLAWRRAVAG